MSNKFTHVIVSQHAHDVENNTIMLCENLVLLIQCIKFIHITSVISSENQCSQAFRSDSPEYNR